MRVSVRVLKADSDGSTAAIAWYRSSGNSLRFPPFLGFSMFVMVLFLSAGGVYVSGSNV